jgi:KaiC/GvpD/RAD55 family RecA-like ATPase
MTQRSPMSASSRFREWMYSLVQGCARRGISLMMIVEVPELFQLRQISQHRISHLSDNVVLLRYAPDGRRLARAVSGLKTRGACHEPVAHRYEISKNGLILAARRSRWTAERFVSYHSPAFRIATVRASGS